MPWFKPKPEKPLREQLLEAQANLLRQIEILRAGPIKYEPGAAEYQRQQVVELRATLREIEAALAETPEAEA